MLIAILTLSAVLILIRLALSSRAPRATPPAITQPTPTPPLAVDPELPSSAEPGDAWEGTFWEVDVPVELKAIFHLDYVDGNDRATERTVEVRQFGRYGAAYLLIGYCYLRKATRTFRSDRIRRCVDVGTGEVIPDVGKYLTELYASSPEATLDRIRDEEFDVLRIMLFVGKADGQLRAPERAIIASVCRELTADSRLDDSLIRTFVDQFDVPSLTAFRQAVGRAASLDPRRRALLISSAEAMVATQKTVNPAEQDAVVYLKARLAVT